MTPTLRRLAVVAVALAAAAGCAFAGVWQWQRHVARSDAVARIDANADADPVPIESLVSRETPLADDDTWRPVRVTGEYLPGATVELRNRPVGGRPAVGLLETLRVTEGDLAGTALVVHRGWVAPDELTQGPPVPPAGAVEVVVRLRPGEPPSGGAPTDRQVRAIAVEHVAAAAGTDLPPLPAYGVLRTEDGTAPSGVDVVPLPDLGFGPHLSYAFQWWVFGLGALVGAGVLIRRDAQADSDTPRPRRDRRTTAEEEEDALLDAAEAAGRRATPG